MKKKNLYLLSVIFFLYAICVPKEVYADNIEYIADEQVTDMQENEQIETTVDSSVNDNQEIIVENVLSNETIEQDITENSNTAIYNIEEYEDYLVWNNSEYGYEVTYDGTNHFEIPYMGDLIYGQDFSFMYYRDGKETDTLIDVGKYQLVITGQGEYYGSLTYEILIKGITVEISFKDDEELCDYYEKGDTIYLKYDGNTHNRVPILYDQYNETVIGKNSYTYAYYKNGNKVNTVKNVGTYTLKIKCAFVESQEISITIKIKPFKFSRYNTSLSKYTYAYNGKMRSPTILLAFDNVKGMKYNRDYTVTSNKHKNIGKYTLIFKGKGNFAGTVELNWKITPATAKISSLSSRNNNIYVTPKKQSSVSGYQIEYGSSIQWDCEATDITEMKKKTKTKCLPLKYAAGQKVYVNIRAYKIVKGKRIYGSWSKMKSIRAKGPFVVYN